MFVSELLNILFIKFGKWFFFPPEEKEDAFTHAVWDLAEAIPCKLKTPLFSCQTMTPEPRLALLQGHCL